MPTMAAYIFDDHTITEPYLEGRLTIETFWT
jgi:hypothetical protein